MMVPVLSHRLVLSQGAKLKKIGPEDILKDIVQSVRVPMVR